MVVSLNIAPDIQRRCSGRGGGARGYRFLQEKNKKKLVQRQMNAINTHAHNMLGETDTDRGEKGREERRTGSKRRVRE